ncbi:hypothetical protein [Sphingomonas humi]|uniref:Transmembrane protein n=1 Tax=Sphingomonas humi TaxID=335630 RepID=A0ABP7RPS0_9SPHN
MIEPVDLGADTPDDDRDRGILLYDYSKHLLSIALLAIGGVITVTQSAGGKAIQPLLVGILLAAFGISGALALSASSAILQARQNRQALGSKAWIYIRAATGFLGMGVGGFLVVWFSILF